MFDLGFGLSPTRELLITPVDIARVDPRAWDAEALGVGCSIRCSHGHLRALRFRYPMSRLEIYRVEAGGPAGAARLAIGVVAVLRTGGRARFYEGLRLAPAFEGLWPQAMLLVLQTLGPGSYDYGWSWSGEPERASLLAGVDGVALTSCATTTLYAVDFARFETWERYFATVSENIRRNYRKAAKRADAPRYERARGASALAIILGFLRVRRGLRARKSLPGSLVRTGLGYLGKLILFPSETVFVRARAGRRTLAAMRLGEFGATTYYFDGATAGRDDGSGWFLMIEAMRQAYQRAPRGRFLLGWHREGSDADPGLQRSRVSLRPEALATNIVSFDWAPGDVRASRPRAAGEDGARTGQTP